MTRAQASISFVKQATRRRMRTSRSSVPSPASPGSASSRSPSAFRNHAIWSRR
jgi:hypothetical protein